MPDTSTPDKQLDYDTYLKALALFTMAADRMAEAHALEAAMSDVLGYENDGSVYCGHISDAIYNEAAGTRGFNRALRLQGFALPPEAATVRKAGDA